MKQKICMFLVVLCIVFIIGIFGGVENGEPLTNLLWCIPAIIVAKVCAVVGGLLDI